MEEGSRVGTWEGVADQHNEEGQHSGCECHINKADIQKGAWNEDRSECISNCKTQFLQSITPGWSEASGWADVCGNLNSTSHDLEIAEYRFWSLYWCDSTFCGVAIDQSKGLGQDRDTDGDGAGSCTDSSFTRLQGTSSLAWESLTALTTSASATIASVGVGLGSVSTIQGTTSVLQESDFSHPPLAFTLMAPESQETAAVSSSTTTPTTADIFTFAAEPTPTSSSGTQLPPMMGIGSSLSTRSIPFNTLPVVSISSMTTSTLLTTTSTSSIFSATHPAASETSTPTSAPAAASSTTTSNGLSNPAKIAIAVCTTIALLMLLSALLLCLRKRRRGKSPHRSLRSRLGLNRKWGGNPTPLISPASSLMGTTSNNQGITPPLRLRERKFIPSLLPSILRPGTRSGSPPLTPLTPQHPTAGVFPSSPICTPTTSKLVPRHERTPGGYTGGLPPIPAPPLFATDSRGSAASSMTATNNSHFFPSFGNDKSVPGSPARPKRPHDGPLEIPDLITAGSINAPSTSTNSLVSPPLSPPPTRALPATPAKGVGGGQHWSLASNSSSNYSSEGGGGRQRGLGGTLYHHQRGSGVAAAAAAAAVVGKERGSWGSWSGSTALQQGGQGGQIGRAVGSVRDRERDGGQKKEAGGEEEVRLGELGIGVRLVVWGRGGLFRVSVDGAYGRKGR
ncbi:hypothetical protein QBC41DRAFT_284972 [Cercophora samala]|uniref:Uncharacterized protein n=1 Tax=Cercophora samala TaxID=330535 RepID=A0AA39Z254_9PEZI|nr:hypothetical protein QBC41DRAFT_284972 [Cercophora samala]